MAISSLSKFDSTTQSENDILSGLRAYPLWSTLAWQDIRSKYRRTILGPFWISFGLGALIFGMGFVYPALFKLSMTEYLPHICTGFLAWFFIVSMVTEGCYVLLNSASMLKQVKVPLSLFAYQFLARNLIVFAHNFIVYVVVAVITGISLSANVLLILPALLAYAVTGFAVSVILGIVCARYRDIPPIVQSVMQVAFFLTPIFWRPQDLAGRAILIDFNPFYHYVEILRGPLMGYVAAPVSWVAVLIMMAFLMGVAVWLLRRVGGYIIFWL